MENILTNQHPYLTFPEPFRLLFVALTPVLWNQTKRISKGFPVGKGQMDSIYYLKIWRSQGTEKSARKTWKRAFAGKIYWNF